MIRRLQIKFVIINMTMVTTMLCVIFGLIYHFTKINLESESIRMMETIAADPLRLGRPNEQSPDLRLPYFAIQLGLQGELVSTGGGYYDLSDEVFLSNLIDESAGIYRETGVIEEYGLRFCRVAKPMGTVLVYADMSSENNTLNNLLKNSLFIGALSFLAFLAISIFLSKWAVKPVAEAWLRQKQFIADASHELKTPLTVILTNAELLQSEAYNETERKSFSRGILLMSRQMQFLVEKMLELAKLDMEQSKQQLQSVDFSKAVSDTALSFEGIFMDKGLSLEYSVEPNICIHGNEQQLRQVADILLDNAHKYSAPRGEIRVHLCSLGQGKCRLSVSNPGDEIPAEKLKKIFQRFYRVDDARSLDGSFGLGLPIAENIVSQHKGHIWAESKNGVITFIVELRKNS